MIMCPQCHIGRMHSAKTTYLQPMGDQILVFPFAPSLVCDVCGEVQYDSLFTDLMEALISDRMDSDRAPNPSRTWAVGEQYESGHRNRMI